MARVKGQVNKVTLERIEANKKRQYTEEGTPAIIGVLKRKHFHDKAEITADNFDEALRATFRGLEKPDKLVLAESCGFVPSEGKPFALVGSADIESFFKILCRPYFSTPSPTPVKQEEPTEAVDENCKTEAEDIEGEISASLTRIEKRIDAMAAVIEKMLELIKEWQQLEDVEKAPKKVEKEVKIPSFPNTTELEAKIEKAAPKSHEDGSQIKDKIVSLQKRYDLTAAPSITEDAEIISAWLDMLEEQFIDEEDTTRKKLINFLSTTFGYAEKEIEKDLIALKVADIKRLFIVE